MPFRQLDTLRYYTFESLDDAGVTHAAITRRGGISPQPWASLNVGGTVGDDAARVLQNRWRSFQALGRPFESLYDVWQVHGKDVICTTQPRPPDEPPKRADAILTDRPEVTLFMRFADCVPIYLYDPVRKVVGLAHAGWLGTVQRTAAHAVQAMQDRYGSKPADLLAGIGPSIASHHYEVGQEVIQQVERAFGADSRALLQPVHMDENIFKAQFDLWSANRLVLEEAGVRRIEVACICTACYIDDWYSHRGENGRTGRFGALIAL
jgi:YfiH family protein